MHDIKPDVPKEFKPKHLMRFRCVESAIEMYKSYADKAGFNVRKSSLRKSRGVVKHRYLVCNTKGKAPKKSVGTRKNCNTSYKVTNCSSRIVIKRVKGTPDYKFDKFKELHNHELLDKKDLKSSRELSYSDKKFIVRA